jgi:hypothetical protein
MNTAEQIQEALVYVTRLLVTSWTPQDGQSVQPLAVPSNPLPEQPKWVD